MIISHKYKFIFIKTKKTAGTSIETYLSKYCGKKDILTPVLTEEETLVHQPRNYKQFFNPVPEIKDISKNLPNGSEKKNLIIESIMDSISRRKFYNHIPAFKIYNRIPKKIWNNYFKFCVERNPWDKTISHFYLINNYRSLSFDEYIKEGNFRFNYQFYMDISKKNIIVDHIIKYENLDEELDEIFDRLNIPFDGKLKIFAKSHYRKDKRSYQDIFQEDYRIYLDFIGEVFKKEINMHGYTFGD